jgi:hypothetical protein
MQMKNLKTLLMFGFAAIIACGGFLVFGTSSVKAGNDMTDRKSTRLNSSHSAKAIRHCPPESSRAEG